MPQLGLTKKLLFVLLPFLVVGAFFYLVRAGLQSFELFKYLLGDNHGWEGRVHASDPELGLASVPGAQGKQILPHGPDISVRYDENGFRIPAHMSEQPVPGGPLVLTLGGSFTYGAGCAAEETYPYLIADGLGGTSMNAAVSSHGLAQMLVLARRLIPKHKPDLTVVQFSSWLVSRSQSLFAPVYFGKLPAPYFVDANAQQLSLAGPVFRTNLFDVDWGRYRRVPMGAWGFLSFFFSVGLPMQIHDDQHMLTFRLRSALDLVPAPEDDRQRIIHSFYREVQAIAAAHGSILLVVRLGNGSESSDPEFAILQDIEGLVSVDAEAALWEALPVQTEEAYRRAYMHWRGRPAVLIDRHPNAFAHQLIANSTLKAIRMLSLSE